MPNTEKVREKFLGKLWELFRLDEPDLDFGFYRIMHTKAQEVRDFIETDLLAYISEAIEELQVCDKEQLERELTNALNTAKKYGISNPEETEPVKEIGAKLESVSDRTNTEAEVYDHLYRFFERYYEGGDFLSRRYFTRETPGRASPFAIPYSGEEVKLHWANADQFYVKSSENFSNFSFDLLRAPDLKTASGGLSDLEAQFETMRVQFRVVDAIEGEHGNIKVSDDQYRFFKISSENPVEITTEGELILNFEYQPLQTKKLTKDRIQVDLNLESVSTVFNYLEQNCTIAPRGSNRVQTYIHLLQTRLSTNEKDNRTLLSKYIDRFTKRQTTDFFIHKDLYGFLSRELDFYLKNEVLNLDGVQDAEPGFIESQFVKVKLIRKIATQLVKFLAQIENFQKKLWLKKKFVVETNYCVTLDRVPEELYHQIIGNEAQIAEWVQHFAISDLDLDLSSPAFTNPLTLDFLAANQGLVLDTKFFGENFKERLLASLEDFDEQCDGILVYSENFQALSLLQNTYRNRVKCIYIDPPYNTNEETFLYKNKYRHSSWLSMISDRVVLSRALQTKDGAFIVSIDDEELYRLKELLSAVMGPAAYIATIVVQSKPSGRSSHSFYATSHEYCLVYASDPEFLEIVDQPLSEEQKKVYRYGEGEEAYQYLLFRRSGGFSTPAERPNSEYALFYDTSANRIVGVGGARVKPYPDVYECEDALFLDDDGNTVLLQRDEFEKFTNLERILPIDSKCRRRVWRWSDRKNVIDAAYKGDLIVKKSGTKLRVLLKERIKSGRKPRTVWYEPKYDAGSHGTGRVAQILGERGMFSYPKSIHATQDIVHSILGNDADAICLDYFAGSGTTGQAIVNLNRIDDGRRKYVLVESESYLEDVLKPILMKVVYAETWKDGKPVVRDVNASHCLKYFRLESYEDTLKNLDFDSNRTEVLKQETGSPLYQDYMLKYWLDVESRGSKSLLNVASFADPMSYTLLIKKPSSNEYETKHVDLIETFNYLIGIRVRCISSTQSFAASFGETTDPELPNDQVKKTVIETLVPDAEGLWWFRTVEGWVPKNLNLPNKGEKDHILIIWRQLTDNLERDNLVLNEWFNRFREDESSFDFDRIYVNGSSALMTIRRATDRWEICSLEEKFMKCMWQDNTE